MEKIRLEELQALVKAVDYHKFPDSTHTVCCLYLTNGFTVIGESACLNPDDFDRDIGEGIAYENAVEKLWQLEGYARKSMETV